MFLDDNINNDNNDDDDDDDNDNDNDSDNDNNCHQILDEILAGYHHYREPFCDVTDKNISFVTSSQLLLIRHKHGDTHRGHGACLF